MPETFSGELPIAGEIKGFAIPWLFQGLHAGKKTGTVIAARERSIKKVYFAQGEVVFASSNLREDWLGELLLRSGIINQNQFDASSELVIKTGKKQGRVLVELDFLTPKELVTGVKAQVRQIIVSLLAWHEGFYIFEEGPLSDHDIIPLQMSIGNLIIEGLRDEQSIQALPSRNTIIRPVSDPSLLFQSAELDADQRKVFSLVDGAKSIEDICCISGLGDPTTLKALSVLLALRMAEAGEIRNDEDKQFVCRIVAENIPPPSLTSSFIIAPDTTKHTATPPKPDAAFVQSLADTLSGENQSAVKTDPLLPLSKEEVEYAYNSLEIQNYYEILGIDHGTQAMGIKTAYFNLTKRFHPDQHFGPAMSEMKNKLEALKNAFDEAYETLIDKNKREQYNRSLASGERKIPIMAKSDTIPPITRMTAKDYFKEGMGKFKESDYWTAEESFQTAVGLDPLNAEYIYYRGLALARIPRRGREAEEFFVRAIELAPANIEYALELGGFYTKYDLKAKALSTYLDALKYNPKSDKIKQAIEKVRK